jgi:hypothetical protein
VSYYLEPTKIGGTVITNRGTTRLVVRILSNLLPLCSHCQLYLAIEVFGSDFNSTSSGGSKVIASSAPFSCEAAILARLSWSLLPTALTFAGA